MRRIPAVAIDPVETTNPAVLAITLPPHPTSPESGQHPNPNAPPKSRDRLLLRFLRAHPRLTKSADWCGPADQLDRRCLIYPDTNQRDQISYWDRTRRRDRQWVDCWPMYSGQNESALRWHRRCGLIEAEQSEDFSLPGRWSPPLEHSRARPATPASAPPHWGSPNLVLRSRDSAYRCLPRLL